MVWKPNNPICSDDHVDWDFAVTALSQHFKDLSKNDSNIDFGPAEIERHFAENCEEDLKIYDKYMAAWAKEYFNNKIQILPNRIFRMCKIYVQS
ncbi:MAG: hypothetical protein A2Z62_01620 [Candidatus Terrybacteria bacterium RIFCSPLOWO2_02_42_20]|uniref:Uncharacterized protein n=2 Tax=Candidatus Terryibacteriota TaxID=1817920 RepID=A0A1G2PNA8_9BACT|nr:MAG: hypothetical protein A2W59_02245 [Candidatus Terrybacteria bacterium RIFCSPHIGHO2_02_41_19]OHA54350.1 MAG: hypothetical protein A2Z62_01620 [Candidatus Terrybacteria bacterium RIFCSPLOWO2_02_42_20]